MARTACRASLVIPLARWLDGVRRDPHVGTSISCPEPQAANTPPEQQEQDNPAILEPRNDLSQYISELENTLELVRSQAECERREHLQRERELQERYGEDWTRIIAGRMDDIAKRLCSDIESVMHDLLRPFLASTMRQGAIRQLATLIEETTSRAAATDLVINAPQDMHEMLAAALAKHGLTPTFSDAAEISVALGSQKHRFEDLSRKWLATLVSEAA